MTGNSPLLVLDTKLIIVMIFQQNKLEKMQFVSEITFEENVSKKTNLTIDSCSDVCHLVDAFIGYTIGNTIDCLANFVSIQLNIFIYLEYIGINYI